MKGSFSMNKVVVSSVLVFAAFIGKGAQAQSVTLTAGALVTSPADGSVFHASRLYPSSPYSPFVASVAVDSSHSWKVQGAPGTVLTGSVTVQNSVWYGIAPSWWASSLFANGSGPVSGAIPAVGFYNGGTNASGSGQLGVGQYSANAATEITVNGATLAVTTSNFSGLGSLAHLWHDFQVIAN
jgi:hypothetical protein